MRKQVYFMSSFSLFSQITIITHKPPCSEKKTNSLFKLLSNKFPNLSSTTVSIFLPCTLGHFYFWTTHTLHFLNTQKTRTRFAPTCRYTSVSWGMRTILDHFGWWTMLNLWKGVTYPVAGPENMSQIIQQGRRLAKVNS